MTFDEFIKRLNPQNSFYEEFVEDLADYHEFYPMLIERKGTDLVEVVQDCCGQRHYPVVDKKLGIVFGCHGGTHQGIRASLYNYHDAEINPNSARHGTEFAATFYIRDGFGYYISVMQRDVIVVGQRYQQDRFDKDLFLMFKVDETL